MSSVKDKSRLTPQEMLDNCNLIMKTAKEAGGVTLRIVGGIAVLETVKTDPDTFDFLQRHRTTTSPESKFGDIDLAGYSKETRKINQVFLELLGFQKDKIVNSLFGDTRRIYYNPNNAFHVDIFLDKLDFNHQIDLRGRLEIAYPNLDYSDLLLSKLQIHRVNEKDLFDILSLLSVAQKINSDWRERLRSILTDDWEFYYDAVTNLNSALQLAGAVSADLTNSSVITRAQDQINQLKNDLETAPKTKGWERRSKKGANKQWWKDVEEVAR